VFKSKANANKNAAILVHKLQGKGSGMKCISYVTN
jgi:hypothetical protein